MNTSNPNAIEVPAGDAAITTARDCSDASARRTASGCGCAAVPTKAPGLNLSAPEIQDKARVLRRHIINMVGKAASGHPGGSLSAAEIVASLYFKVLRHNPADTCWKERDRFILSKGHAAPLLYAALAESGYFPVSELDTIRQLNSRLQGHADKTCTPGVEMSSGSLGQGLSFGIGIALAARLDSLNYRTYVLMGDGECDEGQVWEAAMAAGHFKLDSLTAVIDRNQIQLDGFTRNIMTLEPFADKWRAFGWNVIDADGHSASELLEAFDKALNFKGKPSVIIARTVKGKGVSFMENNPEWHGKAPSAEQMKLALKELE